MDRLDSFDAVEPVAPPFDLSAGLESLGVQRGASYLRVRPSPRATRCQGLGLSGREIRTALGSSYVVETSYPLHYVHGLYRLDSLLGHTAVSPRLARLSDDARCSQLDYRTAVFLDIETTGLGSGAGTYAFLVGIGTFAADEFCLRQYFLRDLCEESALLYALDEQLCDREWWVSFNGRAFDLPVLNTRYVCAHQTLPLAHSPHLDLLFSARRLWRRRLGSCALSSLETGVLGVERQGDVPGWLIPEVYFEYLRSGDGEPLQGIFDHNTSDILSMVTLTALANRLLESTSWDAELHPLDQLSAAVSLEAIREIASAQALYQGACAALPCSADTDVALLRLGALYKRQRDWLRARDVWQQLRQRRHPVALVELAKYHEHHQRDWNEALVLTNEALALEHLPEKGECSAAELQARLRRLKAKASAGGLMTFHIDSYSFGKVCISGIAYDSDVLILPGEIRRGWRRQQGHRLVPEDLAAALDAKVKCIVVGTGNLGMMKVPQHTLDTLTEQGIQVEVCRTSEACRRYNELANSQPVAAALHLAC